MSAAAGKGLLAARRAQRRGDAAGAGLSHDEIAEIVLDTLGAMKGAAMKAGQLLSYLDLPTDEATSARYHDRLSELQDAAAPSDPATIAGVIAAEYGAPADEVFAAWEPTPFAVASIGQVHRARLDDGSDVAVKVQHPGVAESTLADLANLELLVRVPRVHHDWCRPRVLVTDYVDGASFGEVAQTCDEATRDRYGEIIFRFVFGSLYRFRIFNADPHPGNYLFPGDGTVVFIDFGSCKTFGTADRDRLHAVHRAVRRDDAAQLDRAMRGAGLLGDGFDGDFDIVRDWFRLMHRPMGADQPFTYTAAYAREVTAASMDPDAGYVETLRQLEMPASYLMLNRIQFGLTSLLARLQPTGCWGDILFEISEDAAPTTELGRIEHEFMASSPYRA
jgi:predicted unusual protein kinase regulating ubiquinone biosynthesis (AarF/ABC1/UbiB family)